MEGVRGVVICLVMLLVVSHGIDIVLAETQPDVNLLILEELKSLGSRMTAMEKQVMQVERHNIRKPAFQRATPFQYFGAKQDCPFIKAENVWTGSRKSRSSSQRTCSNCETDPRYQPIYSGNDAGEPTWIRVFPTVGQGVMSFNTIRNNPFSIVVKQNDSQDYIALDVHEGLAFFTLYLGGQQYTLNTSNTSESGYDADLQVSYWFSYDRDRLVIKYGKGYIMQQTTIMTYDFLKCPQSEDDIRASTATLFNAEYPRMIEMYDLVSHAPLETIYKKVIESYKSRGEAADKMGLLGMQRKVSFEKNPLVTNRPFVIMDSKDINLFSLDRGGFTFSESLPSAAKELYENVKPAELNYPVEVSDYLLSDAIRYSLNHPGCALYERLQEKKGEFGGLEETYLRVTLGASYGDSPGIPYVLEIWPSKHSSPIHNHGNANAVIKVLFGTINIQIYNKFTPDANGHMKEKPKQLFDFNAFAGNFTWLDRNWYQTHKLENLSDDFCATVQCYKFPDMNNVHWPDFDYVSDENQIAEFLPDSDFTFIEMRDTVMREIQNGCKVQM